MATGTYPVERVEIPLDPHPRSAEPPPVPPPRRALDLLAGVILPTSTIIVELLTGMCAEAYADVLPNWRVALLAAMVPFANLIAWVRPARGVFAPAGRVAALLSVAAVVTAVYSAIFLPMLPLALVAVLMGIGLLPLSPFLALWATLRQLWSVGRWSWRASAIGVGLAAASVAPTVLTEALVQRAVTGDREARDSSVRWLRAVGEELPLRRAAYGQREMFLRYWPNSVEAAKVYFLVTGESHLTRPDPRTPDRENAGWFWDGQQGGNETGRILPDLRASASRVETKVTASAGVQYTEWTLQFANGSTMQQREARAVIALPEGGVVNRVTLWIEGEEREAAFGGRAQTTSAYQSVVQARRDPLLVRTAGPGRVLVQCFPVPPRGEMKIRLGIAAPVRDGRVELPYFVERNFDTARLKHAVWVEDSKSTVQRDLVDAELERPLAIAAAAAADEVWTPDPRDASFRLVRKRVSRAAPGRLIVVVDGSKGMAPHVAAIRSEFARVRGGRDWELIETGNFEGGSDNVTPLRAAQTKLAGAGGGTIVWLHGPQPVEIEPVEPLLRMWKRRPGLARMFAAQIAPGADAITPKLDNLADVATFRAGSGGWADRFTRDGDEWINEREPANPPRKDTPGPREIAALWGLGEFQRLARDRAEEATTLAAGLRLVTSLTGAVVLETKAQYDRFGLDPSHGTPTSAVPEPSTMLLLFGSLGAMWLFKRKRRTS